MIWSGVADAPDEAGGAPIDVGDAGALLLRPWWGAFSVTAGISISSMGLSCAISSGGVEVEVGMVECS